MAKDIEHHDGAEDLAQVREKFIETIGVFAQTEGMPRTAGRLLGLMIFDGEEKSFSSLATELQVSRGSISTSSRLLLHAGLIQRTAKPGERGDYFKLADKPYEALVSTEISRLQFAQDELAKTIKSVPESEPALCQRLTAFCGLFEAMEGGLKGVLRSISNKT